MTCKQPNPTFLTTAAINVDGEPGLIEILCIRKGRKAYMDLFEELRLGKKTELATFLELITGWNHEHPESLVTVPFSAEALEEVLDTYWGAGEAFCEAYRRGQVEARAKN